MRELATTGGQARILEVDGGEATATEKHVAEREEGQRLTAGLAEEMSVLGDRGKAEEDDAYESSSRTSKDDDGERDLSDTPAPGLHRSSHGRRPDSIPLLS